MYSHFLDEHLQGHHKYMCTPEDPATANRNESLYHFIVKSVTGSHVNSWKREVKRIKKEFGEDVPTTIMLFNNKMVMYFIIHASICCTIFLTLGWQSLKYQFHYTLMGMFFLELINYIEHYGLQRKKDENGIYESITKMHSWNSLSSPVLFRIQRHSDHHAHAFRPYQILRRFDDAPYHPFEYLHSFVMCMVPPFWFYIINPRVDALKDLQNGKKTKTCFDFYTEFTNHDFKIQVIGYAFLALF
jgi:alkane 1-monooxygenase